MTSTNEPERGLACSVDIGTRCCSERNVSLLTLGIVAGAVAVILAFYFVLSGPRNPPRDLDQHSEKEVTTMGPIAVNDANFAKEVLQSDLPVLVDFWAPWCGPCRTMNPIVEAVAQEYAGQLKVVKIDVDEAREIAAQFGVTSIPTFVVIQGGRVQDTLAGAQSKQALVDAFAPYVDGRTGNGRTTKKNTADQKVCSTG